MNVLEKVASVLESIGAPYALIGGRAVGARGFPRMTLDYDFLTTASEVMRRETWNVLEAAGASIDPREGDLDDPVAGVVRIAFPDGIEADVLLARWNWEREILERAERLDLGGVMVPVPMTSDLILL